jgi:hypothetical protein
MSPRRSHGDTYVCDQCGTSQDEPLHSGWLEVDRPSAAHVRLGDWWAQQTRYFCSESCLTERLHQRTRETLDQLEGQPPPSVSWADKSETLQAKPPWRRR